MIAHYAIRGNSTNYGKYCGTFCDSLDNINSRAVWRYGAAHYASRGGHSGRGIACGLLCINLYTAASSTVWNNGAALSFKLA